MKIILWLILLAVLGGLAWIRFAPSDPAVWHVDPQVSADQDLAGGVRRRVPGDAETLERLDTIIAASLRTERLAGSVGEGRITYVTRSKWLGFPDYTTVELTDNVIEIFARLRFGQSDMGVNRARVEGWLRQLGAEA